MGAGEGAAAIAQYAEQDSSQQIRPSLKTANLVSRVDGGAHSQEAAYGIVTPSCRSAVESECCLVRCDARVCLQQRGCFRVSKVPCQVQWSQATLQQMRGAWGR